VLADPELAVIRRYGVEHVGKQISLPAVFVVTRGRQVAYAHVSRRLWDRPSWREIVRVLQALPPR
jgi:alkyl hydroperoxide reductase subunit AhpC